MVSLQCILTSVVWDLHFKKIHTGYVFLQIVSTLNPQISLCKCFSPVCVNTLFEINFEKSWIQRFHSGNVSLQCIQMSFERRFKGKFFSTCCLACYNGCRCKVSNSFELIKFSSLFKNIYHSWLKAWATIVSWKKVLLKDFTEIEDCEYSVQATVNHGWSCVHQIKMINI